MINEHKEGCPRLQFWDAGEAEAPCTCEDKFDKNAKPLADVFEEIMAEKDMTNCVDCGNDYDNHDTIDICDPCVAKLQATTGYEVAAKWRDKCKTLESKVEKLEEALDCIEMLATIENPELSEIARLALEDSK